MKLGTLLLRDAVISLSQLEAALRAQVVYGGRLGTNLVELGFVDVDTLGGYLSRVLEVPLATQEHFEAAVPEALDALGPGLADVYTAVALGFEGDDQGTLAVALSNPKDRPTLDKLRVQTGLEIRPYCSPELRLLYYLEKYYNLTRKARFVRSGTGQRGPSQFDDRRRTQPVHGLEKPPSVLLVPKRAETDNRFAAAVPEPRCDHATAASRIDRARSRDSIGEALIEFSRGRFGAAVLFVLRDQNALGWRVYSVDSIGMEEAVEELSLALGGSSALQVAHDSGQTYRGGSPSAGKPVERRLWEATGTRRQPSEMLVIPILVKDRVVNLFYAHPLPGSGFEDAHVGEITDLAVRASAAYARLMDSAKLTPD